MYYQYSNGLTVHQLALISLTSLFLSPVQEDQRSAIETVKSLYRSMKVKKADWKKENERGEFQRAAGVLCVCRLQGDLSAALHRWCCETSSVGTAALLCAMATTSLPANPSGAHLSDSPSPCTQTQLLFLFVSKLASVTLLAVYLAQCNCGGFSNWSLS